MTTPGGAPIPERGDPVPNRRMVRRLNLICPACREAGRGLRFKGTAAAPRVKGCTCKVLHAPGYGPNRPKRPPSPEPPAVAGPI
jgi:hypothetical protein